MPEGDVVDSTLVQTSQNRDRGAARQILHATDRLFKGSVRIGWKKITILI